MHIHQCKHTRACTHTHTHTHTYIQTEPKIFGGKQKIQILDQKTCLQNVYWTEVSEICPPIHIDDLKTR